MSSLARVGALARWHAEMRQGIRGQPDRVATWTYDDLWAAACHEKAALQLEAAGDLDGARYFMDWALCRLHGINDEWDRNAPDTKEGKALLKRIRGTVESARPARSAPLVTFPPGRRRGVTAGLGLP